MAGLQITITDAGRAALVDAPNTGASAVTISHVGVSPVNAPGPLKGLTALPGEVKRVSTFGGDIVADDVIHITINDETTDVYSVRSFGLYLSTGVLFAVFSSPDVVVEKSAGAMVLLSADITFKTLDTAVIQFGGTGFINPPATTERLGVVELATWEESAAGNRADVVVTPYGLLRALQSWATNFAAAVHAHPISQITGLADALAAKSPVGHKHDASDTNSGVFDVGRIPALGMEKVTGLAIALSNRAAAIHGHVMSDIDGLVQALNGKSANGHKHDASDTTSGTFDVGRIPALAMEKITGLANALAGKSDTGHTHVVGDVAGVMPMSRAHNTPSPDAAALGAASGDFDMGDSLFGWHYLTLRRLASSFGVQIALNDTTDNQKLKFRRSREDGSFSAWREVWTNVNFNPNDKAPALHSHDWTQVTGKPDLVPQNRSHGVANPDAAPQGVSSGDMDLAGYGLAGWQLFTSRRAGDNYGTQFAISDTIDRMVMRRHSNGVWSPWHRIWSDAILARAGAVEAAAGASIDHFITPAALWSFPRSTGSPGYAVIPGTGLMIQWGLTTASLSEGETHAYLPVAFGGGCLVALANPRNPTRSIGIDFYMQVVGHFADRIAFFANRGNSSSGNVAGYEWVALGRVSGSPDPAYTENGGGGGGGGNPEIIP